MENNNKLIAEFLGWDINSPSTFPTYLHQEEETQGHWEFKFDTDWNWLMQVVEKIENLKTPITNNPNLLGKFEDYQFDISNKHIKIYAHGEVTKEIVDLRSSESETKIEAVYNACVKFIKWYNLK